MYTDQRRERPSSLERRKELQTQKQVDKLIAIGLIEPESPRTNLKKKRTVEFRGTSKKH